MDKESETSVKVAVRIRPQNAREQVDLCRVCTFVMPSEPQIVLGKDKSFTYDYVYDVGTEQNDIYNGCIENLVEGCFNGLNATVLAYGQTGSGKTYTMGTGFDVTVLPEEQGMIPRAVRHIFTGIAARCDEAKRSNLSLPQFEVTAQFLELYNESIIDLFDTTRENSKKLRIHESSNGNIYVEGTISHHVHSESETLEVLKQGALSRSVGSTNMNSQSSRSHAIFTLIIKQQKPVIQQGSQDGNEVTDSEMLTAKFHFVDLAGSERLKRTGATGERAKEGISINCGLLSLGNVISALGDKSKKGSHVPYRDSKLTRLLQDSLGGNSQTLMIACISPTDRDFMETLNTLKYANRARNITNKVSVNQDKTSAQLSMLRKRIQDLEFELQEFHAGRLVVSDEGSVVQNDLANENTMLKTENDKLRLRLKNMQSVMNSQNETIASLQAERDLMKIKYHDESTGQVVVGEGSSHVQELLQQYLHQIEDLRSQLLLNESHKQQYTQSPPHRLISTSSSASIINSYNRQPSKPLELETNSVLEIAKKNIKKLQQQYSVKSPYILERGVSRRRVRKREYSSSPERMSTDVEAWILKSASKKNLICSDEEEKDDDSDTEVNEDEELEDEDEDECSDLEDMISASSESADEMEEDDDNASIATSIAELTTEINIKQQLVDQLEKSQKSLHTLRSQYEEKMIILQNQIRATETERDKIIKEMALTRQTERQETRVKEMKDKYEKQLAQLRTELKQLQLAKKEHSKAIKRNLQQDTELQKLKYNLSEMKKQKLKLMKQMKEETTILKMKGQRREKEIAQLKKDHHKKENLIRTLQADAKRKEIILKRKNEEVVALRRQQYSRSISTQDIMQRKERPQTAPMNIYKENGPAAKKACLRRRKSSVFSSDSAKTKWRNMTRLIKEAVNRRQTLNSFDTEMDCWVQKREELSHKADEMKIQRDALLQATEDMELLCRVEEELDALLAQIAWANDCIENLQEEIVEFEDIKCESDTIDTTALIHTCSTKEAKYLLENIVNMAIESSVLAYQRDAEIKSLEFRLKTSEQHAELIRIYSSPHAPLSPLVVNSRTVSKISSSFHPVPLPPPVRIQLDSPSGSDGTGSDKSPPKIIKKSIQSPSNISFEETEQSILKHRRRSALPIEFKITRGHHRQLSDPPLELISEYDPEEVMDQSDTDGEKCSIDLISTTLTEGFPRVKTYGSTKQKKKSAPQMHDSLEPPSGNHSNSCPGSPYNNRSTRTEGTNMTGGKEIKGQLETERHYPTRSSKPFICTHTAKGHNGGVLSVCSNDLMFFSASQDCTVKVWDLCTGLETANLTRHHSYVRKVTYSPSSQLVFTACQSLIKLWDLRDMNRAQFVKTLSPTQGTISSSADTVVQDLLVSDNTLFSASGSMVNVWDLRQMSSIGRLVGHNGTVGTMTAVNDEILATGSRDRLIKLYDVSQILDIETGFTQLPQSTLAPAHYDTVSSLVVHKNIMYSACGVSIKQWDINKHSLIQAIDGAHLQSKSNMITSLAVLPQMALVSACKNGILKLWLAEQCQNIGEVLAHKSSITSLSTNQDSVFTASTDKTVKIWRPNLSMLSNTS